MNNLSLESELSDDEIFFGKVGLKEVKKKVFLHDHRLTISNDKPSIHENEDRGSSFNIIEVHSEPEMTPRQKTFKLEKEENYIHNSDPDISTRYSYSNWDVKPEDSFLKLEKMVSKLCMSPDREELDSTLEIVDRILSSQEEHKSPVTISNEIKVNYHEVNNDNNYLFIKKEVEVNTTKNANHLTIQIKTEDNGNHEIGPEPNINVLSIPDYECLAKDEKDAKNVIPTKETEIASVTPNKEVFKTPLTIRAKQIHVSSQKYNHTPFKVNNLTPHQQTPSKKTPHKSNAYQHITSPVASYIRQCPQVPLIKDVFPKKPLPTPSHIPKPVRNVTSKGSNKENVMLPPVAYKSAKKTHVINVPEKGKMPQSPWAKQIATTLPKSHVIRHDHREINSLAKPLPLTHDSYADLSLHQADVSVCTKKSALNKI